MNTLLAVSPFPGALDLSAWTCGIHTSASKDAPITFQAFQTAGPATSLSGANTARAIDVLEGQSYAFRLTVTDDKGASSVARVLVTAARALQTLICKLAVSRQPLYIALNSPRRTQRTASAGRRRTPSSELTEGDVPPAARPCEPLSHSHPDEAQIHLPPRRGAAAICAKLRPIWPKTRSRGIRHSSD